MKLNFISLETSLEKALSYRNNPDMQFYSFKGVQLLPNDIYPYIQTTFNDEGIELEDWQVNVVSICGEVLADITDNFEVIDNFQDRDTGLPQITWSLRNVPNFGERLIYLEVNQLIGQTFYSTPFYISSEESERTARIDYRNEDNEIMQSTRILMYYRQPTPTREYSQYYEITTKRTRTNTIKSQYSELWRTDIVFIDLLVLLQAVFDFKQTYVNLVRTDIFEPFEIPLLEEQENFSEIELKLTFDKSDVYDPNYVAPIPEPLPPLIPKLRITDIRFGSKYNNFLIDFEITDLISQYLTVLYQVNGATAIRNTASSVSPRTVSLPFTQNSFFTIYTIQLYYAGSGIYSNKAFINQGAGYWLLVTEKISDTQFKLKAKYTSYIEGGGGATMTWTNNGVSIVLPNTGEAETTINITEGQVLTSTIVQTGTIETITVTL